MLCRVMCLLLFLAWTAEAPNDTVVYYGLWRSPFQFFGPLFQSIPGVSLFPWQIVLISLAPLSLLRPGSFRRRAWPMDVAIFVSFASAAVTFLWGWLRGGSAYNAYYQLWRFLAGLLVALLLLAVVRRSRDLRALGSTLLLAALVRSGLAVYFYWTQVRGQREVTSDFYLTTHDDSVLFVAGVLVLLAWALMRRRWTAWLWCAVAGSFLLYAMILNNRRIAWIELLLSLGLLYLLLPRGRARSRVNLTLAAAAPLILVYVVVGWGREGALFEPLRAFSTVGSYEDSSSLARLEEIRNLMYTISVAGNPLLGTGWGVPYQQVTSIYTHFGGRWWQYPYMPHNSLMGLAAFGGFTGIFGMWMVVPVAGFAATRGYRLSSQVVDRAAALAAICILPAYGVQCYGDLGLQSFTCNLILGVAMAVAGKVPALAASVHSSPPREGGRD